MTDQQTPPAESAEPAETSAEEIRKKPMPKKEKKDAAADQDENDQEKEK